MELDEYPNARLVNQYHSRTAWLHMGDTECSPKDAAGQK